MPKKTLPLLPLKDFWLPVLPLLPLVIFTALLSGFIDFESRELDFLKFAFAEKYLETTIRNYTHIGDLMTYYSISLMHIAICISVIFYFVHAANTLPKEEKTKSRVFLLSISTLLAAVIFCFAEWANDIVLVQLGFKATCVAIDGANLATRLIKPGACFEEGYVSTLTWLAWLPTFAGMGAVVFAAAFAYGNAGGLPAHDDPAWRNVAEQRIKALQRSVYALSAVLVSSTITITLFASLPRNLFGPQGTDLAKAMSGYVSGLSTFWGVLFSLTLVATFAVPAWRMLEQTYGRQTATGEAADLRAWLHEHVFVSFRKQLGNALVVLAPLLTGSFSSIFSFLLGK